MYSTHNSSYGLRQSGRVTLHCGNKHPQDQGLKQQTPLFCPMTLLVWEGCLLALVTQRPRLVLMVTVPEKEVPRVSRLQWPKARSDVHRFCSPFTEQSWSRACQLPIKGEPGIVVSSPNAYSRAW